MDLIIELGILKSLRVKGDKVLLFILYTLLC
jgi:hypothetical protein